MAIWNIQFAVKEGRLHLVDPQEVQAETHPLFWKQTHDNLERMLDVLCERFPEMRTVAARSGHLSLRVVERAHEWQPNLADFKRYQDQRPSISLQQPTARGARR